jgi:Holliday junction DNA helicase RuvA
VFNSITGTVNGRDDSRVFLLTGGIEWEIEMPQLDANTMVDGENARVWTWLCHREDAMTLYGFADERRRAMFRSLLKVDGVGPRAALKILGGITQNDLEAALEAGDLARLQAVPGLGKKTAQKVLLALKGKVVHGASVSSRLTLAAETPWPELADALVDMGYDRRSAITALDNAANEVPTDDPQRETSIFRKAIVHLSGAGLTSPR